MNNEYETLESTGVYENPKNKPTKNEINIQTLTIYKILFSYYDFNESFKDLLSNTENINIYHVYLIDANWFNDFKRKYNYTLLEKELKKDKIKDDELFLKKFTRENPISRIIDESPKAAKVIINKSDDNKYYCENYVFLDKNTMQYLFKVFKNVSEFHKYKFILKKNTIILVYNNYNLEITHYNNKNEEKYLFTFYDNVYLKKIYEFFKKYTFEHVLKKLEIKDKSLSSQKIIIDKDNEIGIMTNLLSNNEQNYFNTQENFYRNKNMNCINNMSPKKKNFNYHKRINTNKLTNFKSNINNFFKERENKDIKKNLDFNNINEKDNKIQNNNNLNNIINKKEDDLKNINNNKNLQKNNFIDENKDKKALNTKEYLLKKK